MKKNVLLPLSTPILGGEGEGAENSILEEKYHR